jgi:hypothetical protein
MSKAPNSNTLPSSVEKDVLQSLTTISSSQDTVVKLRKLQRIWEFSEKEDYKIPLCAEQYQLLPFIKKYLENEVDVECIYTATGILWYLSRNPVAKRKICDPQLNLLPILFRIWTSDFETYRPILNCLSNCTMDSLMHPYLLSNEFHYISICKQRFHEDANDLLPIQTMYCISLNIEEENAHYLLQSGIPQMILQLQMKSPPNPTAWQNPYNGIEYWCLNFITCFCCLQKGREMILEHFSNISDILLYFDQLLLSTDVEQFKGLMILANLLAEYPRDVVLMQPSHNKNHHMKDNQSEIIRQKEEKQFPVSLSIVERFDPFEILVRAISCALFYPPDDPLRPSEVHDGFAYGVIKLSHLTCALKSLAILSYENRLHMKLHPDFFPLLHHIIELFVSNKEECKMFYQITFEVGGGGGEDYRSMENVLVLMLQLLYDYNFDGDGRENCCDNEKEKEVKRLLQHAEYNTMKEEFCLEELDFIAQFENLLQQDERQERPNIPGKIICLAKLVLSRLRETPQHGK